MLNKMLTNIKSGGVKFNILPSLLLDIQRFPMPINGMGSRFSCAYARLHEMDL